MRIGMTFEKPRAAIFLDGIRTNLANGIARRPQRASDMILRAVHQEIRAFAKKPTGKLERSYRAKAAIKGKGAVVVTIFSNAPHARIHELGGTIKPKKAGSLVIPLTERARAFQSPRSFPGKLFRPRKPGGGVENTLASSGGRGGGITRHYALVQKVRVKPKKYLTKAMEKVSPKLERLYEREIVVASERAAQKAR